MDPLLLGIVKEIVPVLAVISFAAIPIGILWVIKGHQYKMKELDVDAMRASGGATASQLAAIEARLSAIESALNLPQQPQNTLAGRAALLEGPAITAPQERVRER